AEEWTHGSNAVGLLLTQIEGLADYRYEFESIEAFQSGTVGWAAAKVIGVVREAHHVPLRMVAVFNLIEGAWKVALWQVSEPTPNDPEIMGVELTDTLSSLIESIQDGSDIDLGQPDSPTTTVTVVFTDVEGSADRAVQMGDREWGRIVSQHFADIEEVATKHQGMVVKTLGDGAMLVFNSAAAGVGAALDIHRSVARLNNGDVRVRVGVHTGDALRRGGDYQGQTVDKAARVAAAATPGQTLVTETARALLGDAGDYRFSDAVILHLKGIPGVTNAFLLRDR
ncbi:MAG: adenylate/guanylate cyclase domain-containing protein, partial [Acidimicrobiia bacterium]